MAEARWNDYGELVLTLEPEREAPFIHALLSQLNGAHEEGYHIFDVVDDALDNPSVNRRLLRGVGRGPCDTVAFRDDLDD